MSEPTPDAVAEREIAPGVVERKIGGKDYFHAVTLARQFFNERWKGIANKAMTYFNELNPGLATKIESGLDPIGWYLPEAACTDFTSFLKNPHHRQVIEQRHWRHAKPKLVTGTSKPVAPLYRELAVPFSSKGIGLMPTIEVEFENIEGAVIIVFHDQEFWIRISDVANTLRSDVKSNHNIISHYRQISPVKPREFKARLSNSGSGSPAVFFPVEPIDLVVTSAYTATRPTIAPAVPAFKERILAAIEQWKIALVADGLLIPPAPAPAPAPEPEPAAPKSRKTGSAILFDNVVEALENTRALLSESQAEKEDLQKLVRSMAGSMTALAEALNRNTAMLARAEAALRPHNVSLLEAAE